MNLHPLKKVDPLSEVVSAAARTIWPFVLEQLDNHSKLFRRALKAFVGLAFSPSSLLLHQCQDDDDDGDGNSDRDCDSDKQRCQRDWMIMQHEVITKCGGYYIIVSKSLMSIWQWFDLIKPVSYCTCIIVFCAGSKACIHAAAWATFE